MEQHQKSTPLTVDTIHLESYKHSPIDTFPTMTSTLAPFCKVRIPDSGSNDEVPCYRKISTSALLTVDGAPSLEMLRNLVTVLLQEKQAPALVGLRYFDEEGDLVELLNDEGLEEALTMCPTKLKIECILKRAVLELSLYGREHASILIDYSQILKSTPSPTPHRRAAASYYKLLQVATEAFHIPPDYAPPMLLRVSIDGSKIEITNDVDLSAHLERVEHTGWVEPVQIEIVGSYLTIAAAEGAQQDPEDIPLSQFLNSMGELSFAKLLTHARRKNPHRPIQSFLYLDATNASKQVIASDRDLVRAMHQSSSTSSNGNKSSANTTAGGLTIHPHYQSTELLLNPEHAVVSGTCELGNDPLRPVMLNAPDSMAMWDVSNLVPGRYKAKARYFRAGGPVSLYTGKLRLPMDDDDDSSPEEDVRTKQQQQKASSSHTTTTPNYTAEFRQQLQQWRLEATGDSVTNGDQYDWVALGELEIQGTSSDERFCVASQPPTSWFGSDARVAVKDISLIFVGL